MKTIQSPVYRAIIANLFLIWCSGYVIADITYQQQRDQLVERIKADVVLSRAFLAKERLDDRVLDAIRKVPRHEFVPQNYRHQAYKNRPLPIGYGQTISQPAITNGQGLFL